MCAVCLALFFDSHWGVRELVRIGCIAPFALGYFVVKDEEGRLGSC